MKHLFISLLIAGQYAVAQPPDPAGAYYLRGVTETASGFLLKADSTFQFFYSYGMLDRFGTGRWSLQGDRIIFNSRPRPPRDFRLIASRKDPGDSITVSIRDENEVLLQYVHCQVRAGGKFQDLKTDEKGNARFPFQAMDSIALIFQLCPDRWSVFPAEAHQNYFEFGFEPWIVEVFFDHFSLDYDGTGLTGKHPLIQGEALRYEKSQRK